MSSMSCLVASLNSNHGTSQNPANFKFYIFFSRSGKISTLNSSSTMESKSRSLQLNNEAFIPSNLIPSSSNLGMFNLIVEACIDNVEPSIVPTTHAKLKRKVQWQVIRNF